MAKSGDNGGDDSPLRAICRSGEIAQHHFAVERNPLLSSSFSGIVRVSSGPRRYTTTATTTKRVRQASRRRYLDHHRPGQVEGNRVDRLVLRYCQQFGFD